MVVVEGHIRLLAVPIRRLRGFWFGLNDEDMSSMHGTIGKEVGVEAVVVCRKRLDQVSMLMLVRFSSPGRIRRISTALILRFVTDQSGGASLF